MAKTRPPAKSARDAARDLARARRLLDRARQDLAQAKRSGNMPPYAFSGPWQRANAALEEHRQALARLPNVAGHGLGHRIKDGIETDEPCVVVFVRRKKRPRTLERRGEEKVPAYLRHGKQRVATDIVAIGRLRPQLGPAGSIGRVGSVKFGTVGALATDLDTGGLAAITAMHTFGQGSFIAAPGQGRPMASPAGGARLGELVLGTTQEIDAAKILLDDPLAIPPPLPVAGIRQVANEVNIVARMFGAVSGLEFGVVKYLKYDDLAAGLTDTLLVDIDSRDGDSGSGLVDNSGFLLGFLFGEAPAALPGDLRVFCPADRVTSILRCSIP